MFSVSKVQGDLPHWELRMELKGSNVKISGVYLQGIHAAEIMCTHGRIARYNQYGTQNQESQNDWPKKGSPKEMSIKMIQTVPLRHNTLDPPVSICMYCTFPPNKYFAISTFWLYWRFSCKVKGQSLVSLTTGLVAEIQLSHCHNLTSISQPGTKCCFKLLRAEAHEMRVTFESVLGFHQRKNKLIDLWQEAGLQLGIQGLNSIHRETWTWSAVYREMIYRSWKWHSWVFKAGRGLISFKRLYISREWEN